MPIGNNDVADILVSHSIMRYNDIVGISISGSIIKLMVN